MLGSANLVLPLSAPHARGPYELRDLILGLLVHLVVIGLPIAFSVGRYGKSRGGTGIQAPRPGYPWAAIEKSDSWNQYHRW